MPVAFEVAVSAPMADGLSRLVFFPYQMPDGLFASLIGAPDLAWTLTRQRS